MNQNPLDDFRITRSQRDATAVIRGYVYQVNRTLLRWIDLQSEEVLELEAGEDIDTVYQAIADDAGVERLFEAVKHRERKITLRSPEALAALADFQEHRQSNPSQKLRFRYVTNTSIAAENPPITSLATPGIYLWERIQNRKFRGKQKSRLISEIRSFLEQSPRPGILSDKTWCAFVDYVKRANEAELNRFIDAFEWSVDQGSCEDLKGRVLFGLGNSGQIGLGCDINLAFAHLFHFVFSLLASRSKKVLTTSSLGQELKRLDRSDSGMKVLSRLSELESQLHLRFDRLEQEIGSLKPIILGISEEVTRIAETMDTESIPRTEKYGADSAMADTARESRIVATALLVQNEALAAAIAVHAKDQVLSFRQATRKGKRSEVLEAIRARKMNQSTWLVLPNQQKAEFLRLEASILLSTQEQTADARQLIDEARHLDPGEPDDRLRAWLAFSERDLNTAIALMEGKEQSESRNLYALFLLLSGRATECLHNLPPLSSDPSTKAETLRLRCLASLHLGDLASARISIDSAVAAEPDWPILQCLSARVTYYEALAPAALPPPMDGSPDPSNLLFLLNSARSQAKIREAAEMFSRLAQSPENSVEDRRFLEAWYLACLASDRSTAVEARSCAAEIIRRDPGQYRIIPWIVAQRYGDIDLSASEKALDMSLTTGNCTILEVLALVMLKIGGSRPEEAVGILDAAQPIFSRENNDKAWQHLRVLALYRSGEVVKARAELEGFDREKRDPLWAEILKNDAMESGEWDSYAGYLKDRYEFTKMPDALLEYCDFQARRRKWSLVADLGLELVVRVGTSEALLMAAVAFFNAGRPTECLDLLNARKELFDDQIRSEALRRILIAAKKRIGDLIGARKDAEGLSTDYPATGNLLLLAELQLDTGDLKALAVNVRCLYQREDLDSANAVRLAGLIRREDSLLAELLWRRAVSAGVSDEHIGAAISLGYQLGLDREMAPLVARMCQLGDAGEAGIERKTVTDLVDYAKRHHKDAEWLTSLYRRGEIAIHLIPTRTRAELVTLYHANLLEREGELGSRGGGIFVRHGGRVTPKGFPEIVPQWRLNLDLTTILLAEHLDVLSKIESTYSPIRIPSGTFLALAAMQDAISPHQISQLKAARDVVTAVDNGEIYLIDPIVSEDSSDLAAEVGSEWVNLYESTRANEGYLIDFLPKISLSPSEHVVDLGSELQERLVNCRAVVEALRLNGSLSQDEYQDALQVLGTEGGQPVLGGPPIENSRQLFCQGTIIRLLAQAKLIKPISRIFRLSLPRSDFNEMKGLLQQYSESQESVTWLDRLSGKIREEINRGRIELIPINVAGIENDERERTPDVACLFELLTFASKSSDVICADDRYINGFSQRDNVPIISLIELLKTLVTAKELTLSEYYRILIRLRSAGAFFIVLDAQEILHHLCEAPIANGGLLETPALSVLRRNWAQSLVSGKNLQKPDGSSPANRHGEASFLDSSLNAVRDALTSLWLGDMTQSTEEREIRSEWILQELYVDHCGIRSLTGLPPTGIDDNRFLGISLGSLVLVALKERLTNQSILAKIAGYLGWLDDRILSPAFERDGLVLQSTAEFIRVSLRSVWRSSSSVAEAPYATRLISMLIDVLPSRLREAVQNDETFSSELQIKSVTAVAVGDLRFLRTDYLKAAQLAINGKNGTARVWPSGEDVAFEQRQAGAPHEIVIRRTTGENLVVADPLTGLLHDSLEEREKVLDGHPEWFDCSRTEQTALIENISREENPAKRIDEAQHLRDASVTLFYNNLANVLKADGRIIVEHLRPPSAAALLRHYRLKEQTAPDLLPGQLESGMIEIADEYSLVDAFVKYGAFPIPLPPAFFERLDKLTESEKHQLVKTLLHVAGSPVSLLHLFRIVVHLSDIAKSPYRRLATRIVGYLLSEDAKDEYRAFRRILLWTESAFAHWSEYSRWSATTSLAMVWAHSHWVYSALRYLRIAPKWIHSRFSTEDFGLFHELLEHSAAYSNDIASPRRMMPDSFVVSGLAYAVAGRGPHWWTDFERQRVAQFIRPVTGGNPVPSIGLLRNRSLGSNVLGSFLRQDSGSFLRSMEQDDAPDTFSTENLDSAASESLENLRVNNTEISVWNLICYILGDFPVHADMQQAVESAILAIDLKPFTQDLDSCQNVLYSASLQASTLGSEKAVKHLSEQMISLVRRRREQESDDRKVATSDEEFFVTLIQIIAHLSWSQVDPHNQCGEFTRLLGEVMDAYPAAISLYRPALQQLWPCPTSQRRLLWPLLVRSRGFGG